MANKNPSPATRFSAADGNKPGRPKESRDRLSRALLTAFADDFEAKGVRVIQDVRVSDPSTYLRIAATLIPKEIEVTDPLRVISDDKLAAAIEALSETMKAKAKAPPPPKPQDKPQHTVN